MRELVLSVEIQTIFNRIRSYHWTLNVYGMSPSRALWLVKAQTQARINRTGVTLPYSNVYQRYVNELVGSFRHETGTRLIQAIQLAIRKWANLGLDPALLQELLGDCFLRFEQQGHALPKVKRLGRPPRPARRRHRYYEAALKKGRAALHGGSTVEEQAARQKEGAALATDIARRLRPVLQARGIKGHAFIPYFNFAQQLGRLSRKYSARSLQMAAANLVDLCEAKSLDGDTLLAIATTLFGISVDD
jgi:hypothetical protein